MDQRLRKFAALREDLNSVPSTYVRWFTTILELQKVMPSSGLCGCLHTHSHIHTKMHTHIHIIKIKYFKILKLTQVPCDCYSIKTVAFRDTQQPQISLIENQNHGR